MPNEEYTFTVTTLPGKYRSIDASGGAVVTVQPTTTNTAETNITFKGKFSDNPGAQVFTVSYGTATPAPTFNYVIKK